MNLILETELGDIYKRGVGDDKAVEYMLYDISYYLIVSHSYLIKIRMRNGKL